MFRLLLGLLLIATLAGCGGSNSQVTGGTSGSYVVPLEPEFWR